MSRQNFDATNNSTGFFKPYFQKFRSSLTSDQISAFEVFTTDEDRVKYISTLLPQCENLQPELNNGKSKEVFQQLRERGNAEFVRGDTSKSLGSYTRAILSVPFDQSE